MSKHSKGAAAAVPSKTARKKPGPHARAKARQAAIESGESRVVSVPYLPELQAAQARLTNAEAERVELENAERRQRLVNIGAIATTPVVEGEAPKFDRPLILRDEPKSLTLVDAFDAADRCLDYTAELVDRVEKRLASLLRPASSGDGPVPNSPTIQGSGFANRVRQHTEGNARVNARLIDLLNRLDLPAD